MDKRTWIIFGVAVIAILAGLIAFSRQSSVNVDGVNHSTVRTTGDENSAIADQIFGKKDSKVTLIEYGDFQCPGCGTFHSNFAPVMDEYKDKITFVFRNFPITQIHPNARVAAASAEAAGLQGKYWEMWNILYGKQNEWSSLGANVRDAQFEKYAMQLGLDVTKFKEDVASDKVAKKINFDQSLGKNNGVTGTPSLFLNGATLATDKYSSTDTIRNTLDAALKEAGIEK
ncbi:DsbA family protein [Candidatus Saccharibacteria bacterium]|nr:DsbA family protein [Candidatus Saccharibacteria bacterium]